MTTGASVTAVAYLHADLIGRVDRTLSAMKSLALDERLALDLGPDHLFIENDSSAATLARMVEHLRCRVGSVAVVPSARHLTANQVVMLHSYGISVWTADLRQFWPALADDTTLTTRWVQARRGASVRSAAESAGGGE